MPLFTDSDAALREALSRAEPAQRARLELELEAVRARARASGADAEALRLAEALVFALNGAQQGAR
jgi:hypothetical protein